MTDIFYLQLLPYILPEKVASSLIFNFFFIYVKTYVNSGDTPGAIFLLISDRRCNVRNPKFATSRHKKQNVW